MAQTYEAIYENGIFRPVQDLPATLAEGQHVRVVVDTEQTPDILQLAAQVYSGLSPDQVREVEAIALERRDFFTHQDS
ncbi:MAG: antitoxin family protein [Abitibacteriaceae bacterium]|nr:antitoxin family protein [Abditibacteriaceae bacterium]